MSTRFASDHAKRVAACKKCKMQLPKGTVRLAKITPNPFVTKEDGPPPDMKAYFHPKCLFETFYKARATTKVIDSTDDIEDFDDLEQDEKDEIITEIAELAKFRGDKAAGGGKTPARKTPAKKKDTKEDDDDDDEEEVEAPKSSKKEPKTSKPDKSSEKEKATPKAKKDSKKKDDVAEKESEEVKEDSKYNSFYKFCQLCDVIGSVSKYTDKSSAVRMFITKESYDGDIYTLISMLLPSTDQRVYNMKEKQLLKHFATIFDLNYEELMNDYKNDGDVSITIKNAIESNDLSKTKKSDWSIQKINRWLTKLTEFTKDEEQISHLKFAAKRLSALETMYLIRLIIKDLRFNAGVKHILDGVHESAYEAFQSCRDLNEILKRCKRKQFGSPVKLISVGITLGTPVLPMLAEACKSVEQAMKRCTNGMYAEIKYDGERVQVHKSGSTFNFYSRALKPVQDHKVKPFQEYIPQAFPSGADLILDAEVLMVEIETGKPLPFGTLGIHKREQFANAVVCLFVFDILKYNDEDLTSKSLNERKELLNKTMVEVPNRVVLSKCQVVKHGDKDTLRTLILKAIDEGLEGLVLKDVESKYEPGKRHWLKVKKDYLQQGQMADTADLLVLGAYFGTGSKGGIMSVFLMGVRDPDTGNYRTVTKCGNGHTDDVLDKINKVLKKKMKRIDRDYDLLPKWLSCSRSLVPDFIIEDPKEAPVWEITGAEFSKSTNHTAGGVSIRFPRVTRIRDDKDWQSATNLKELVILYNASKVKSDVEVTKEDDIPLYAQQSAISDSTSEEKEAEAEEKKPKKRKIDEREPKEENQDQKEDKKDKKPICKYGSECYRKNPAHLEEYFHPTKA